MLNPRTEAAQIDGTRAVGSGHQPRWHPPSLLGVGIGTLAVCLVLMQVRDLLSYSRWYTDEDQTLLWLAGRDLLHLQLHAPNFWGQDYNTTFEAFPGAIFHQLGVTLSLAVPLGATVIATLCWVILALGALRGGSLGSGVAALAIPTALSVPYLLLFDQLRGVLTGDLAAATAAAIAVGMRRPLPRLALVVAIGGIGIVWDYASALIVLPAVAGVVVTDFTSFARQRTRSEIVVLAATAIPAGLYEAERLWYQAHPGYLEFPSVRAGLDLSVLWRNLSEPQRVMSFFTPELAGWAWLVPVLLGGLLASAAVVSWRRRSWSAAVVGLAFGVTLLAMLSTTDTDIASTSQDLYLNGSRYILTLPMGAWVVAHHVLRLAPDRALVVMKRRVTAMQALAATTTTIVLASTITAQIRFASQIAPVVAVDSGPNRAITVIKTTELSADCHGLTRLYRTLSAEVLLTYQRSAAYGCAAETGLNTLIPSYDRRAWLVARAARVPVKRLLIQGGSCTAMPLDVGVCRLVGSFSGGPVMLVVTPPRTVVATLRRMGQQVYGVAPFEKRDS